MKFDKQKVKEIAAGVIEKSGYLFIDFVVRGSENNSIIEIYVDNAVGVTANDCAEISRKIADLIEEAELINTKYRFEVSSPGTERPLIYLDQYNKHVGRSFEIEFVDGELNRKETGKLLKIEADELYFQLKTEEVKLILKNIKSAKVTISF